LWRGWPSLSSENWNALIDQTTMWQSLDATIGIMITARHQLVIWLDIENFQNVQPFVNVCVTALEQVQSLQRNSTGTKLSKRETSKTRHKKNVASLSRETMCTFKTRHKKNVRSHPTKSFVCKAHCGLRRYIR